jgi:hypothetical protein
MPPLDRNILLAIVLVLALVAVGAFLWVRNRRRTAELKSRFGSEYDRTVSNVGDEKKAEALLHDRQKRVASYTIKPLPADLREHFVETWRLLGRVPPHLGGDGIQRTCRSGHEPTGRATSGRRRGKNAAAMVERHPPLATVPAISPDRRACRTVRAAWAEHG